MGMPPPTLYNLGRLTARFPAATDPPRHTLHSKMRQDAALQDPLHLSASLCPADCEGVGKAPRWIIAVLERMHAGYRTGQIA